MEVAEEEPATLRSRPSRLPPRMWPRCSGIRSRMNFVTDKVLSEVARMPESQATHSADVEEVVVEAARTNRREKKESGDALGNVAMEDPLAGGQSGHHGLLQPGW